jgi:poly(3-hydroxybutyrate) depolymerase
MCFILQVNFQLVLSFVLSLIFLKEANTSMFQVDSFTVELINILILLLFHIAAQQKDLSWFENNVIMTVPTRYPGAGRKVYPGFIQLSSFIAMNMESHVKKHKDYFSDVFHGKEEESNSHRNFYDEYLSVLDLNGEFYLETIDRVFLNQDLANGKMTYHGELVDLSAITDTALHTIEGQNDDICSLGQTQAAHKLCSGIPDENKLDQVFEGVGHFGTFSGSAFRNRIAPSIAEFIEKHN